MYDLLVPVLRSMRHCCFSHRLRSPDLGLLAGEESSYAHRLRAWQIHREGLQVTASAETPTLCPICHGIPAVTDNPECRGCIECDFHGTFLAYQEQQRWFKEAMHAAERMEFEDFD